MTNKTTQNGKVSPYDVFIVAITLLSIGNMALYLLIDVQAMVYAITAIDILLSGLFFVDFVRLFAKAESKAKYFFRDFGWADLLASAPFPQLKVLRIFRLIKAYGLIKRAGVRNIFREFSRNRASAAIFLVLFTIILLLEFGSVGILAIEGGNPAANITSASDAIWWVYVTITTVGYGDAYPVTNGGRILGMFVMLVGVGLFGVVTGFLSNKFLPPATEPEETTMVNRDASLALMQKELSEIRELLERQKK